MPWPKLWSASADRDGGLCHVAHSKSSGLSACVVLGASGSDWPRRGHRARGQADQAHRQTYSELHGGLQGFGEALRRHQSGTGSENGAQAEAIVKKNGFANLDEYDDVAFNISMILPGIDPQTKKFTQPPEQIKREIAALKANKSISAGKAHSVHGEHRAGPKVLRPTFAAHAGAGFEPATCGLEIHGHLQREAPLPVCAKEPNALIMDPRW
jgi:hypothetical protein